MEEESKSFFLSDEAILIEIKEILNKLLMQRNIHHYYKLIRKLGKGGFASVNIKFIIFLLRFIC